MATKSFTNVYSMNKKDVSRFYSIINDTKKVKINEVKNHESVREKRKIMDILQMSKNVL